MPLKTNTLYYGDNLPILREYVPDESVDLIYLDPPFNSNRNYNVLFKETSAGSSPAQIGAFEDTWHWGESAQQAFEQVALHGTDDTARLLKAMVDALGHNDVTAYLSMMAVRLIELRRVLKPTGSIYLHCDPTASHYLKVLMDSIFGAKNYRNDITWLRHEGHSDAKRFGSVHDVLLYFQRGSSPTFRTIRGPYSEAQLDRYKYKDEVGPYRAENLTAAGTSPNRTIEWRGVHPGANRHWMWSIDEMERLVGQGRILFRRDGKPRKDGLKVYRHEAEGKAAGDVWTDVPRIANTSAERLGYPTQKPLALLERIITASSNEGDVVLDPFCGCGTAVHAAQKLGRRWIGIDITHLAIGLIRRRMEDAFPELKAAIKVVGEPADLPGATELAARDPYQFQWWALDRLGALPAGGDKKKGMDRGIDGVIPFVEGATERRRVIVSVKSGNLTPAFVRDLKGVLEREGEPIGVLVALKAPTREIKTEAIAAGSYHSERWGKDYARIQIITAADLLNGVQADMPPQLSPFAAAPKERIEKGEQGGLMP